MSESSDDTDLSVELDDVGKAVSFLMERANESGGQQLSLVCWGTCAALGLGLCPCTRNHAQLDSHWSRSMAAQWTHNCYAKDVRVPR